MMQSSFIFKEVHSNLWGGGGKSLHVYDNENVCVFFKG